jgi:hypothetical protein
MALSKVPRLESASASAQLQRPAGEAHRDLDANACAPPPPAFTAPHWQPLHWHPALGSPPARARRRAPSHCRVPVTLGKGGALRCNYSYQEDTVTWLTVVLLSELPELSWVLRARGLGAKVKKACE